MNPAGPILIWGWRKFNLHRSRPRHASADLS
jgi:hypothetical protein